MNDIELDEVAQECLAIRAFINSKFKILSREVNAWEPRPYKAVDDTGNYWEHQSRVSTVKKREQRETIPGQPSTYSRRTQTV